MKPTIENRVIVRVWTSCVNHQVPQGESQEKKAEASVGHISVEINKLYISLWPEDSATCEGAIVSGVSAVLHPYDEDVRLEGGREPERVICLYTLNSEVLKNTFESSLSTLKGWTLLGGTPLMNKDNSAHSCSSLAEMLLSAGGMDYLLKEKEPKAGPKLTYFFRASGEASDNCAAEIMNYVSVSPDSLLPLVSQAKLVEMEAYPVTLSNKFKYEGESSIADVRISALGGGFGNTSGIIEYAEKRIADKISKPESQTEQELKPEPEPTSPGCCVM